MDKTDARILARAALEAIAEPTKEMTKAAVDYFGALKPEWVPGLWLAMHAAMMREEK